MTPPFSPRTQKLVSEHLPLLEPFGVGSQDIANIVTECKYDTQAIALRVQALVNSKCDGFSTSELLWQRPKGKDHPRQSKPHSTKPYPKRNNYPGDKNKNKQQSPPQKKTVTPAAKPEVTPPTAPTAQPAPTAATSQPAGIQHISSPISKTVDSSSSRVRPGQTWAQRVKGNESTVTPVVEEEPLAPVELKEEPKKAAATPAPAARPAPPQVFSWVAAAQGKRLVREEDTVAPPAEPVETVAAPQPEEEDEVECPQPVPDRVCDMQCVSSTEQVQQVGDVVAPPAGFESEPRARYHPASPPVIKQREQPLERPPMYDQRAAANSYIQRTAYNAYHQHLKYAAYGMDYFAAPAAPAPPSEAKAPAEAQPTRVVDNVMQRHLPPMYHHHPPMQADAYGYEATSTGYARDYYIRPREPERVMRSDMMYGYSRPPVMPPMFAAAAGRNEMAAAMVHQQPPADYHPAMYHHHYAPRAPEFYSTSSQWR